ncbi:hypothetical protein [Aeromonas phage AS-zj]|uniref:Uncharacterized protein n=1 Tax=Aeromonas phage AS-zj TaxID=2024208 RepID=A0A223LFP0_9CAUD|nr:hypothetical protein HWB28_gp230 [Aeromonas phage AS-zj]ASU00322.1 hypothetical protein [Aeromonas phage AS-zj]
MKALIDTKNVQLKLYWVSQDTIDTYPIEKALIIGWIMSLDSDLVPMVELSIDEYNFLLQVM